MTGIANNTVAPRVPSRLVRVRGFLRAHWGAFFALGALACLLITGRMGIDFGGHNDEPIRGSFVNEALRSGTLLPSGYYVYPSLTFYLELLGVVGKVFSHFGSAVHDPYQHAFVPITAKQFAIPVRTLFLVVSSLGGIWTYLGIRRIAGEFGAAFGAAVYLLSWQFAYHARWVQPDAVLASFAALVLFMLLRHWDHAQWTWRMYLPAVAAGLAAGTKYQGAVFLLPDLLFVIVWGKRHDRDVRRIARSAALSGVVFIATFLVTTPGALLQPRAFIHNISYDSHNYKTVLDQFHGASVYDVTTGYLGYLWKLLKYVFVALPSRYSLVSVIIAALVIVGLVAVARKDRWLCATLTLPFAFLFLYYPTFVGFIVRNFLVFLPFIAVFAGYGAGYVVRAVRRTAPAAGFALVLVAMSVLNGAWLTTAAASIRSHGGTEVKLPVSRTFVDDAIAWMKNHPSARFAVSAPFSQAVRRVHAHLPKNADGNGHSADYFVFLFFQVANEHKTPRLRRWPANEPGSFTTFGADDVDFDYYPTYKGDDRVIILTKHQAQDYGLTAREASIRS